MKVEELTVNFTEAGTLKVRELDKVILSQGSWATIAFLFDEWDSAASTYKEPRVQVRRYRKQGAQWVVEKHLVFSTAQQALAFAAAIDGWHGSGKL